MPQMMRNGKKQTYIQLILFLIKVLYVFSQVNVSLQNKPVIIGETAQISCIYLSNSSNLIKGISWYVKEGKNRIPIVHNGLSKEKSKYTETDGKNNSIRVLNILKFNGRDVNKNYSCEIGLDESWLYLDLNEKDYVYYPVENDVFVTMSVNQRFTNIKVFLYKLYPLPENCTFVLNSVNFVSTAVLNVVTKGIFFAAELTFRDISFESMKAKHNLMEISCESAERFVKMYEGHLLITQRQMNEKSNSQPGLMFFFGLLTACLVVLCAKIVLCIKDRTKSTRHYNDEGQETAIGMLSNFATSTNQ